jgi:hypothetical protein
VLTRPYVALKADAMVRVIVPADQRVNYSMAATVSLTAIVLSGLTGCSVQAPVSQTASSTATASPDDEGRSPASYFRAGDCIVDLSEGAQEAAVVDCAKPHAAEVYAVFLVPEGKFPGEARIKEFRSKCSREAFADYSPTAVDNPDVHPVVRFPDEKSWELGDRSVTCIVTLDPPRTGSLRGQ